MVREARVLEARASPFSACAENLSHLRGPLRDWRALLLMERRRGTILRDQIPPSIAVHYNYARRISRAVVDCLVKLHAVDVEGTGLIALGKPEGFVARQVKGWSERWERARTEPSPEMDRVMDWLAGDPSRIRTADARPQRFQARQRHARFSRAGPHRSRTGLGNDSHRRSTMRPGTNALLLEFGRRSRDWTSGINRLSPGWYTRDEFVAHYTRKKPATRSPLALPWHEVLKVASDSRRHFAADAITAIGRARRSDERFQQIRRARQKALSQAWQRS